jgi:hypothetical protein
MERTHSDSHRSNLTQESLRGGVLPLNGGSGGRSDARPSGFPTRKAHQDNPQTRVLPPLGKSSLTNTYRLPLRLVQQLLLVLLCSSCTHSPIDPSVRSQPQISPPPLTMVRQAQTVEIYNDWNGYSDITPILRHYKLRTEHQSLIGNSHIAIGGYGAAGIHQQQTTKVKIPAAVTVKFLTILSQTPLQVGTYKPKLDRSDDYPSIEIKVKVDRRQIIFSSQSQGKNYIPWKVTVQQKNITTAYISNSPFPDLALQVLRPYLDRPGIDQIIQRRRPKKILPTPHPNLRNHPQNRPENSRISNKVRSKP